MCNCQSHLIPDPYSISAPDYAKIPCFDVITPDPRGLKPSVSFSSNQLTLGFPTFVSDTNKSQPAWKGCVHPSLPLPPFSHSSLVTVLVNESLIIFPFIHPIFLTNCSHIHKPSHVHCHQPQYYPFLEITFYHLQQTTQDTLALMHFEVNVQFSHLDSFSKIYLY